MYKIVYTKTAIKQIPKLKSANLSQKVQKLIDILRNNPYQNPPPYEKLSGDLKTAHSRRINAKHRLVYRVFQEKDTVMVISMWTHYEY